MGFVGCNPSRISVGAGARGSPTVDRIAVHTPDLGGSRRSFQAFPGPGPSVRVSSVPQPDRPQSITVWGGRPTSAFARTTPRPSSSKHSLMASDVLNPPVAVVFPVPFPHGSRPAIAIRPPSSVPLPHSSGPKPITPVRNLAIPHTLGVSVVAGGAGGVTHPERTVGIRVSAPDSQQSATPSAVLSVRGGNSSPTPGLARLPGPVATVRPRSNSKMSGNEPSLPGIKVCMELCFFYNNFF